jgi:hypothetical protein
MELGHSSIRQQELEEWIPSAERPDVIHSVHEVEREYYERMSLNMSASYRSLVSSYMTLNQQLGLICLQLNYPMRQGAWPDCRPLEEISRLFPDIESTKWYRSQLKEVVSSSDDPLFQLIL